MRRLILLRHGEAERATEGEIDFDRALTPRGREDAGRIGRWLADQVGRIDLALVSPATRARQTWEEAGAAFPGTSTEHPTAFYAADPAEMLRAAEAAEAGAVIIVAHNPGLHALALQLAKLGTTPPAVGAALRSEFPAAAAVVFARAEDGPFSAVAFQAPAGLQQTAPAQ